MTRLFTEMPPWLMGFLGFAFICFMLTFWSIKHAYSRDFPTGQEKMIWLLVLMFLPFVGCIAYLVFGRNRGRLTT